MSTALTNPSALLQLAGKDIDAVESAELRNIYTAIRAGARLIAAKALVDHGEWLPLLVRAQITKMTAARYMRLAAEAQAAATLTKAHTESIISGEDITGIKAAHTRLTKWIDGRTLTEIQQDLGLRPRKRLPAPDNQEPGTKNEELPPETQQEFAFTMWFGPKTGLIHSIRADLASTRAYAHLPRPQQQELLDDLVTITTELRALLKSPSLT